MEAFFITFNIIFLLTYSDFLQTHYGASVRLCLKLMLQLDLSQILKAFNFKYEQKVQVLG